ncbi:hypothetical protein CHLNCDRAFT_134386 [Chlorella variabilis]|uniref:Uncharacterized protein n=1 Tax=Chlorella variabilis TaxID=554065 RepID=E1ZFW4_CHLVA|nr:hypothetical protein CHLNCDRAFT_134386 [Chlorella variabilis]EFN55357.1 hypothetical protein CHLNCDRAFT_134386 [Chlorella variabilis]|eukprot:XP_005847459.1 hypothetical protein CHLNCDRAFT_134386 [Chlorella variabilis]
MSSKNAHGDMCMDWPSNHKDAAAILGSFLDQQRLRHLPLYALGVSVGGGFVAKLAAHIKMDGVVSEVLGPKPVQWDLDVYQYGLPPIVFVSMDQDPPMAARISACSARLRQRGGLTATVRVAPRVVYPTFFSDRSSRLSPEVSAKVVAALHEIDMLDERGMVTVDPRHTRRPWVKQLVELVPELNGGMMADHSQVWEEMNLAWSSHEIISDFATPAFVWFEGGATADFAELVERYAAPGHMGVVGDAADAIPPPAAPIEAAAAASMPSAVQHVYEAHEARVEAAEAQAAAAAAAARVHLPAGIQKEQSAVVAAAAGIQRGSGDPTQQASAVRELGANGQQRPQLRPGLAQQQQQQQQQPAGTLVLPDQQAAGQREQASSGISAASVAAGQPLAAASSAAAATMQQGQEADAGEASPEAGAAGGPSPAAILGGVGGAAAGVALLLGIYQLARRTDGFQALPVTEPRAPGGCLLAPAEPLPLSTRLPPIPELPESPAALA